MKSVKRHPHKLFIYPTPITALLIPCSICILASGCFAKIYIIGRLDYLLLPSSLESRELVDIFICCHLGRAKYVGFFNCEAISSNLSCQFDIYRLVVTVSSLRNLIYVQVSLLKQEYMFMPQKVKHCYLVYLLRANEGKSMIVFTSTCRSGEYFN